MKSITNNHWREILYDNEDNAFFRYNKQDWYLSEFMRTKIKPYNGIYSLGFFVSIAIIISDCGDAVKVFKLLS